MTRVLPRTHFHSSKLIRCLAELGMADASGVGNAFAEKLGLWIHFTDAITLSAVHSDSVTNSPKVSRPAQHDGQTAVRTKVGADLERIQALLTNSVLKSCSPGSVKSHIKLPEPILELPLDLPASFAPYRRFYEAHQRDMDANIQPLRINVREALAKTSPRLRKLAELDATLETILRDREIKLLAKMPVLLKKRFEHLFREHQQKLADAQVAEQTDNPAGWMQTGGWLARFRGELQMLLLAEVEFRLQPATGLMEALNEETRQETQ
jgi:hypothetical protein